MLEPEFRTGVIRPVECYKEAWELMKDQYWLIFAVVLVGILVASIIPVIIVGPMMIGIYLCLLDKIDGGEVNFDRLFKGFDQFLPSLMLSILITLPVFVMIILIYVPMIMMAFAGPRMNESDLFVFIVGVIVVELVFGIFMVCFHTLLLFSFPLMADRRVSVMDSIKLSARAVWKNMGGVVGLFGVGFVVAIIGYLMLCIGLYLVLPLIFMANAVAYRKIFPSLGQPRSMPPPPSYYQGFGGQ